MYKYTDRDSSVVLRLPLADLQSGIARGTWFQKLLRYAQVDSFAYLHCNEHDPVAEEELRRGSKLFNELRVFVNFSEWPQ